jgi:flagellar motor switch protein FliN/FliY
MNSMPVLRTRSLSEVTTGDPAAASSGSSTAHIISLGEMPEAAGADSDEPRVLAEETSPLNLVKVSLQVCIGQVSVTVGELLAAQQHQILVLDQEVDQPIDLLLEGRVVARGHLVAVEDRFAVRILELPVPLKP